MEIKKSLNSVGGVSTGATLSNMFGVGPLSIDVIKSCQGIKKK